LGNASRTGHSLFTKILNKVLGSANSRCTGSLGDARKLHNGVGKSGLQGGLDKQNSSNITSKSGMLNASRDMAYKVTTPNPWL
jgi:hypothetical protein